MARPIFQRPWHGNGMFAVLLALLCTAPAAAQDDLQQRKQEWLPGGITSTGIEFVRAGTWTLARSQIHNPSNQDKQLVLAVSFDASPYLQFTWPVWVPARSSRIIELPIRGEQVKKALTTDFQVLLLDPDREQPLVVRDTGIMHVETRRPSTGMLQDSKDDDAIEAVTSLRLNTNSRFHHIHYLREAKLPAVFIGWEGMDNLVIARNKVDINAAQTEAMRQWLVSGGRLWVMMDQVDPDFLNQLLGDDWAGQIVDYIELNEFRIDGGRDRAEPQEFEVPVKMARLFAPGWEVIHKVRGWPASLTKAYGLGRVILTTVGPRAWYRVEWRTNPRDPTGRNLQKHEIALMPLRDLASRFMRKLPPPPLPNQTLAEYAQKGIGYKTLPRTPVAWILGSFTLGFALIGLFLMRKRALEHVSWIGVILSAAAAALLITVGSNHQGEVPLTMAVTQLARVLPHQKQLDVQGALAIYSPEEQNGDIHANHGGILWPTDIEQSGDIVRLQWLDVDRWIWDGLKLPKGTVKSAAFRHIVGFEEPAAATVQFGPQGAVCTIEPGPFKQLEDVVLIAGGGRFAPQKSQDNTFTITPDHELPRSEYFLGTLSSVQQRRRNLYAHALGDTNHRNVTAHNQSQPMLYAWSDTIDLGLSLSADKKPVLQPSTLLAIPWQYVDTPNGTQVTLPSGFIPFRLDRGPKGKKTPWSTSSLTLWDREKRRWISDGSGARLVLRFQLPSSVLPLEIEDGTWTIHIDAPGRKLEAVYFLDGSAVALDQRENVVGRWDIALPGQIECDEQGRLRLGLSVEDVDNIENPWHMQEVRLLLRGSVNR